MDCTFCTIPWSAFFAERCIYYLLIKNIFGYKAASTAANKSSDNGMCDKVLSMVGILCQENERGGRGTFSVQNI